MALYLSPLVDVNEIDLSTTIPAVATSIGVIVLQDTYKGYENKQVLVTSVDELIESFGQPDDNSYKDIMAAAGFLKYGNTLYCTRVLAPSATFAGVYGTPGTSGTYTAYTTANSFILSDFDEEDPDEFGEETTVFTTGRAEENASIAMIARDRGVNGNYIKVAIIGRDKYNAVRNITGDDDASASSLSLSATLFNDLGDIDYSFDNDKQFLVLVRGADQEDINKTTIPYTVKETFLVSTDIREIDDEGDNKFCENYINSNSRYIRMAVTSAFKDTDMSTYFNTEYSTFAGGQRNNSDSITDADIIEAYELYDNAEEVDVNIFIDSDKSVTVKTSMDTICQARKDAMAVLDVTKALVVNNKGFEATNCRDWRRGIGSFTGTNLNINTSYSAVYANWLNVYDKWNAKYRWIPASGHVAGIYANTDDTNDPWFAPAGLNRAIISNVRKLAWNPSKGARDILYKNGLNPIVSFAGQGKVVWGQKNLLDKSSAFNRVNVRRLFMILAKAISTALKYFLFEPNDSFTRLQIINMIEPFLRDVQARRGIYEYMVVCDSRNNTAERIDRNELWCDIYIKPTRAAEFIVLNLIATKTGASFTELVAAVTPS